MSEAALVIDVVTTERVGVVDLAALRALAWAAFASDIAQSDIAQSGIVHSDMAESDWQHALGGHHAIARLGGRIVGHASVVPRTLLIDGEPLDVGYVEAVATEVECRNQGVGSAVMARIGEVIAERYALGALSTALPAFYARLGWQRWRGPSYVVRGACWQRTPDEDDGLMVLSGSLGAIDVTASIACHERAGDSW